MSRLQFNGVSKLSYNGTVFSFALDDTYQLSDGQMQKQITVELATDLKSAEGVCKFLLSEIEKIKLIQTQNESISVGEPKHEEVTEKKLKLGKKISSSVDPHND